MDHDRSLVGQRTDRVHGGVQVVRHGDRISAAVQHVGQRPIDASPRVMVGAIAAQQTDAGAEHRFVDAQSGAAGMQQNARRVQTGNRDVHLAFGPTQNRVAALIDRLPRRFRGGLQHLLQPPRGVVGQITKDFGRLVADASDRFRVARFPRHVGDTFSECFDGPRRKSHDQKSRFVTGWAKRNAAGAAADTKRERSVRSDGPSKAVRFGFGPNVRMAFPPVDMNHVRMTTHRTILDVLLRRSVLRVQRDHNFLATGITNVAAFVVKFIHLVLPRRVIDASRIA